MARPEAEGLVTDEELDLVETEQLARAIGRRCEGFVLIVERDASKRATGCSERTMSYDGGWSRAVGLLEHGKYVLLSLNRGDRSENNG